MEINEDVNMETTNQKVKIMLVSKSTKDCWTADAILSRNVMAIACTAHFKKKVAKGVGIYVTRGGRPAVVEKRETPLTKI